MTTLAQASQTAKVQQFSDSDYDYVYGSPEQSESEPASSPAGGVSSYQTEGNAYPVGINWGKEQPGEWGTNPDDAYSWAGTYSAPGGGGRALSNSGYRGTTSAPRYNVSISKTVFPKGTSMPSFAGPSWDEGEIRKRTRKAAAPGLRRLEMGVQQAMSKYYENPNVRRTVLRDTLAGYGLGVSNVMAQAESTGRASYGADYSRQYQEAMGAYNRSWQEIMAQASHVSTSLPVSSAGQLEDVLRGTSGYTGTTINV